MRKLLLSLALVCLSMSAFAQEPAEAKTEVNQYGQKVEAIPVNATVQDGILVFQNKSANYKMWFDVRIQADAAVYFGAPDFCAKEIDGKSNTSHIGNVMSIRRARFAVFTHPTLTNKYINFLTRKVRGDYINTNAQPTGEHEVHTSSCAHESSIENRIILGFFHNSSEAIREAKRYYNNVDECFYCCPESHRRRYPKVFRIQ